MSSLGAGFSSLLESQPELDGYDEEVELRAASGELLLQGRAQYAQLVSSLQRVNTALTASPLLSASPLPPTLPVSPALGAGCVAAAALAAFGLAVDCSRQLASRLDGVAAHVRGSNTLGSSPARPLAIPTISIHHDHRHGRRLQGRGD